MVNSSEPFQKLIHQGTITNGGAKMSKSKGNVVNPDDFVTQYGSDVFRMYLMFMGPYELGGDWNDKGIVGIDRFVQRVYTLFKSKENFAKEYKPQSFYILEDLTDEEKKIYRKVNFTISKFEIELQNFRFNTAVAVLMELMNEFGKSLNNCREDLQSYSLERFAVLLASVAPHLSEECWSLIGHESSLFENPKWYQYDENALTIDSVTIVVQVNGKVRAKVNLPVDSPEKEVKKAVWQEENIKIHTNGKSVIKEIYIKNKIYNIVVK